MKKRFWFLLLFCICILNSILASVKETLRTYAAPQGTELNDDFTVRVRQKGGGWVPLSTYLIKVDEVRNTKHNVENASMTTFDFSGVVEIAVTSSSFI